MTIRQRCLVRFCADDYGIAFAELSWHGFAQGAVVSQRCGLERTSFRG